MDKSELWVTITGLVTDINELLKCRSKAFSKTYDGIQPDTTKPILELKQLLDSLQDMRMSIKYIIFDLEATRRENVNLRKFLKGQ